MDWKFPDVNAGGMDDSESQRVMRAVGENEKITLHLYTTFAEALIIFEKGYL